MIFYKIKNLFYFKLISIYLVDRNENLSIFHVKLLNRNNFNKETTKQLFGKLL
jgi:hypothetical protein